MRCRIKFPDFERVGWVNHAFGLLWPHLRASGEAKGRERIGAAIEQNRPRWLASVALTRHVAPTRSIVKRQGTDVQRLL